MASSNSVNRYSDMAGPEAMKLWEQTFKMFDRDGGGDVDLRELGLMFRQLGQTPTERQMLLLIEEVDADGSGTVDFEEFCCLMLRQQRALRVPAWLDALLPAEPDEHEKARLPTHALLSDPKFEAARRIQATRRQRKGGKSSDGGHDSPPHQRKTASKYVDLTNNVIQCQAIDRLSRDELLMVIDLLPSAQHIESAHVSGHGPLFGPFVAAELSWRLSTSTRTRLSSLELAFDAIGDEGAVALARTLRQNTHLTAVDLSGNNIGARGATALMAAICLGAPPPFGSSFGAAAESEAHSQLIHSEASVAPKRGAPLKVLLLDDNPIPAQLAIDLQVQLLLNNLSDVVTLGCRSVQPDGTAFAPPPLTLAGSAAAAVLAGMPLGAAPACTLTEEWLAHAHVHHLRKELNDRNVRSLELLGCGKFGDHGASLFFAPPPPNAQMPRPPPLEWLRISGCALGHAALEALAAAAVLPNSALRHLRGLALDQNALSLDTDPNSPSPNKPQPQPNRFERAPAPAPAAASHPLRHRRDAADSLPDSRVSTPSRSRLDSYSLAHRLGNALRRLPMLEQLDLSSNNGLSDSATAEFCTALLASPAGFIVEPPPALSSPEKDKASVVYSAKKEKEKAERETAAREAAAAAATASMPPSALQSLHLGGTQAGNATAGACAAALKLPGARLECLCIGGDAGDVGAHKLAEALMHNRSLKRLYIGCRIGDMGVENLSHALRSPGTVLEVLHLGGVVRGNVWISNRLETRSGQILAEALRAAPEGALRELRLSGNHDLGGGAACFAILGALQKHQSLRVLHLDGCGLSKVEMSSLVEICHEVWCLHELVVDRSSAGAPKASAASIEEGGAPAAPKKLLSLQQKIKLTKILQDNRTLGRRRVESWKLSKSLDEVQWVFNSLCAGLPAEEVDGGLDRWQSSSCAQFVVNAGFPHYKSTFAFNLRGPMLATLTTANLTQLGVHEHREQIAIMESIRSLVHAYDRKKRVAKANSIWTNLLGMGGLVARAKEQIDLEAKLAAELALIETGAPAVAAPVVPATPATPAPAPNGAAAAMANAPETARRGRVSLEPLGSARGGASSPEEIRQLNVGEARHTAARSFSPRGPPRTKPVRAPFERPLRIRGERGAYGLPLPMIEQPAGVEQPTSHWPKKSLSSTSSATLHAAQQNAAAARQARTPADDL